MPEVSMPSRGKVLITLGAIALIGAMSIGAATVYREQKKQKDQAIAKTGGNPDKAILAIMRYGCAACHQIPDAQVPGGLAASPLSGIKDRVYLGGIVYNTPDNLIRWIVNPKQFDPKTGMPVTGITDAQARDVAAYLYLR
jgi:cytochrome c1